MAYLSKFKFNGNTFNYKDARIDSNNLISRATSIESRATSLEGRATTLESRATAVEGRATTLEGKVETFEDADLDTRVSAIEDADLDIRTTMLESEMYAIEGRATALESGKIPKPETSVTAGKFLKSNGAGEGIWEDAVPTSSIQSEVQSWLASHVVGDQVLTLDNTLNTTGAAADAKKAGELVASQYNNTKTYAVGDYCKYDGVLYRCSTAIDTAEAWDSTHWTAVSLANEITDFKSTVYTVTGLTVIEMRKNTRFPNGDDRQLDLINGFKSQTGCQCAVIECNPGDVFTINATTLNAFHRIWAWYNINNTKISMADSDAVGDNTVIIAPPNAKYLTINDASSKGVSYFGKQIASEISEIKDDISDLKQADVNFTNKTNTNKTDIADLGKLIDIEKIDGWNVGCISGGLELNIADAVANPNTSATGWRYVIIECLPGDVFTINGNSSNNTKAFYFVDELYNVLTRGENGSYINYIISAPTNAKYLIINKTSGGTTKNSYKGIVPNNKINLNITGIGSSNMMISGMNYPPAVYFNRIRKKMYWGYTTADGYIGVASYDFNTHEILKNNLHKNNQIDDHNSATVYVCPDGTVICGYSTGHNLDYCMHIRRSSIPENIEYFDNDIIIAGLGVTSNCEFAFYNSKLYMFYRSNDYTWLYRTSLDNGVTWSVPTTLVSSDNKMYIRICKTTSDSRLRLLIYNVSTSEDVAIRQGFMDLSNGNIYDSDNATLLGVSDFDISDFTTLISPESTLPRIGSLAIAVTAPERPLIAYAVFNYGDDNEYRIYDNGTVTSLFNGGWGLMNYYFLGMAWRGDSQIVIAHGSSIDGGTDLIDLFDYLNGTITYVQNIDHVIRGNVPIRVARPFIDDAGQAVLWIHGYYNRSDYTDFNTDIKMYMF